MAETARAPDFPDHPLWDFSLRVYGSGGVGDACIALQEAHGLDVNVLLYCCWLGASGRGALGTDEMAAALAAVAPWQAEVVRAIRAIRRRLKGGIAPAPMALSEPLRRRLQDLEVDCEHLEQLVLAQFAETGATVGSDARAVDAAAQPERRIRAALANIGTYLTALGATLTAADRRHLATVMRAAFEDLDPELVQKICDGLSLA